MFSQHTEFRYKQNILVLKFARPAPTINRFARCFQSKQIESLFACRTNTTASPQAPNFIASHPFASLLLTTSNKFLWVTGTIPYTMLKAHVVCPTKRVRANKTVLFAMCGNFNNFSLLDCIGFWSRGKHYPVKLLCPQCISYSAGAVNS